MQVGQRRLADQLRLRVDRRFGAFVRMGAADRAAAAFRPCQDAGFEQRVTGVPVAVLRPAQLPDQRGVPDRCAIGGNQCQQVRTVGALIRFGASIAALDGVADSGALGRRARGSRTRVPRCRRARMTCRPQPPRGARAAERGESAGSSRQPGASMTWEVPTDRSPSRVPAPAAGTWPMPLTWGFPVVSAGGDPVCAGGAGAARPARVQVRLRRALAARPAGVPDSALSIGPRLRALAVYLVIFQHVPVERCRQLIADVTGAAVSDGFIHPACGRLRAWPRRWCG